MAAADPVASREVVLDLDADGLIIGVDRETEEVTGYTADELFGSHFHALVGVEQSAFVARQFERKRRDPSLVTSYQVEIRRSDETRLLVEVTSCRVEEPGEPLRVRATLRAVDGAA